MPGQAPQSESDSGLRASEILLDLNKHAAAHFGGDKKSREEVIQSCLELITELEAPGETMVRMTWIQPSVLTTLYIGADLKMFDALAASEGSPKSSVQIAEATSADPALIYRILRTLASVHLVRQVDVDLFAATAFSKAVTDPHYARALYLMTDFCIPVNLATPAYFKEKQYRNPTDALDTPTQYHFKCSGKTHMFELLQQTGHMPGLASMMQVWQGGRPHWSDLSSGYFSVNERLFDGARRGGDEVFLVDVGGSQGHDLVKFLQNHPAEVIPGRLILQDQPHVIESIPKGSLPWPIEATAHDFFTPQPLKGARAYFYHNIIHDHNDANAIKILQMAARSMEKGYSKLILWDQVLADKNVAPTYAALDWEMMTYYAGGERSESQWRALLEHPEVGLKVVKVWFFGQYDQTVIEAELA